MSRTSFREWCLRSTSYRRRCIPLCDRPPTRPERRRIRPTPLSVPADQGLPLLHPLDVCGLRRHIGRVRGPSAENTQPHNHLSPASLIRYRSTVRPMWLTTARSGVYKHLKNISYRRRHLSASTTQAASLSLAADNSSDRALPGRHLQAGESREFRFGSSQIICSIWLAAFLQSKLADFAPPPQSSSVPANDAEMTKRSEPCTNLSPEYSLTEAGSLPAHARTTRSQFRCIALGRTSAASHL